MNLAGPDAHAEYAPRPMTRKKKRIPSMLVPGGTGPKASETAASEALVRFRKALGDVRQTEATRVTAAELRQLERMTVAGSDPARLLMEIAALASRDPGLAGYLEGVLFSGLVATWKALPEAPDGREILHVLSSFAEVRDAIHPPPGPAFRTVPLPDFMAVAHDLLSPITSIVFLSSALQHEENGPLNDIQRRNLSIVASAALSLSNFVKDLVEFVRADTGSTESPPSEFSIRLLFESIRDLVNPFLVVKGVSFELEVPEEERRVGNPVAISRVLLNLTTNALKFTDSGGVTLSAREMTESRVEFSVSDSGRGVDVDVLENLSPYRRGDGPRGFDSFGLGLSICRKILKTLDSSLRLESELGSGSRFYFEVELPSAAP